MRPNAVLSLSLPSLVVQCLLLLFLVFSTYQVRNRGTRQEYCCDGDRFGLWSIFEEYMKKKKDTKWIFFFGPMSCPFEFFKWSFSFISLVGLTSCCLYLRLRVAFLVSSSSTDGGISVKDGKQ